MGLPDPEKDPVSPLLAMVMNATVSTIGDGGAALAGKVVEGAKNAGDKAMTATANAAPRSQLVDKNTAPDAGETVKAQKELARGKEIEPTITADNKPSLDSSLGKAGLKAEQGEEMKMASSGHFVGTQGQDVALENLGKPIAVGVQTQSQGLSV